MIDPQKKARDADRDAAVEIVEAAWADGQITQADRDLRVERLLRTATIGEIASLVRDLRASESEPDEVSWLASLAPQPPKGPRPKLIGIVIAAAGVVLALGLPAMFAVVGTETGSDGGISVFEQEASIPDLTRAQGWDQFVAAVEEKTGSTVVWSATVYPGYAVIEVPVDERSQRSYGWYWNGDWREWTGKGSQPEVFERVDLGAIEGAAVGQVVAKARRLVEDPTSAYVVVRGMTVGEQSCFSAYASNDFSQSGYLNATCAGEVLRSH